MKPDLLIAPRERLAQSLAERCAARAGAAIAARGRFVLAVPGGSVAQAFLPALARAPIDWQRTHLFWCDERAVPRADPESNAGLFEALCAGTPMALRVHRHEPNFAHGDVARAAADYAREMQGAAGSPPLFDFILLGTGEDGHVCSLFPGHPALEERRRWVVAIDDSPKPPAGRITMTLPVLEAADVVCIAAFGSSKAELVRRALRDPSDATPLARVLRAARSSWMMLDEESAALL